MSTPEISEDEMESFDFKEIDRIVEENSNENVILLSSDDDTEDYFTSDDSTELPAVDLGDKKKAVIKKLFPTKAPKEEPCPEVTPAVQKPSTSNKKKFNPPTFPKPLNPPGFEKMIGGVKVNFPVNPYGCQIALISQLITAMNKRLNCLLESPTGSGKTLALLCGALAWQHREKFRIAELQAHFAEKVHQNASPMKTNQYYSNSPSKIDSIGKIFDKNSYGERSIYDKPVDCTDDSSCFKRQESLLSEDESPNGLVNINKKRKLNENFGEFSKLGSHPGTPEKSIDVSLPETYAENMRLPIIYYGARTHKQLQQVVKEFGRTWYCGQSQMTILSSRDYSCIREFDKAMWGTKNDMCRGCTKRVKPPNSNVTPKKGATNCEYYDNYEALNRDTLPPAFDLEDLTNGGHELKACPYFAARDMAKSADIVFCPYNYLIEPTIRRSMQIDLQDNIVIIDEGHNIEDICRDAATFSFSRDDVIASIKELEEVAKYRFANQDVLNYIDKLIITLRNWDNWFVNQTQLLKNKPLNNNEAVHAWEVEHFVDTLNNHNIGQRHYIEFSESAEIFCKRLREDPSTLYGVTQATGTLIESMDIVLGYLFRDGGRYKDDFKPVLIKTVYAPEYRRNLVTDKERESISLRLLCLSPAVIFSGLKKSRCVVLASGTLTPLLSLHSELGAEFPLQVSPNHVIPKDRVWIGSLTTCPDGRPLECKSRGTDQVSVQDALGEAIEWVCSVTPNGVLCFLPSYSLMNKLHTRWEETGLWGKLINLKHVFMESRNTRDHNDIMEEYYKCVSTNKGALLFAVYRGKVSEGMDFKDHQARAVITIGVPYPNTFDLAVKEKMKYNDKYCNERKLLSSSEWLRVQAYRALNQAVGRCVRHRGDWGAVLLVDARFTHPYYTDHLSKWVRNFLGNNHHTYESLVNSPNSLESFMQTMTMKENDEI